MDEATSFRQLRRQRNLAAGVGLAALAVLLGVGLPRAKARHDRLKAANGELLRLQADIVERQDRLRGWQGDILRAQDAIRELQAGPRSP